MPRDPPDLLQGTLDALILCTLARKPTRGCGISQSVPQRTVGVLEV
jgi:DNA-binding PadR family transcriptional regulator